MEHMTQYTEVSSLSFCNALADMFCPGVMIQGGESRFRGKTEHDHPSLYSLTVSGECDFSGDVGVCKMDVAVPSLNDAWLRYPPIVTIYVDWLSPVYPEQEQLYANWHRYPSGELCWIEPISWSQQCATIVDVKGVTHMIGQLFKDVDFLLNCHMIAFCHRIRKWSPLWSAAPHGYRQ